MAIALPATIIPIGIAAFAAYAFAWMDFQGRRALFIVTVSLLAMPLQMALIPLLQLFNGGAHLTIRSGRRSRSSPTSTWRGRDGGVAHPHRLRMPFAIFLLHNYISSLPRDLFEAARIDGADHLTIFWRLVLPLSVPVLAAFAIFQFLWTWNDYLVALTLLGASPDAVPDDGEDRQAGRRVRLLEHLLHGRRVRPGRRAAGGVLPAAALLREGPARRLREGLTPRVRSAASATPRMRSWVSGSKKCRFSVDDGDLDRRRRASPVERGLKRPTALAMPSPSSSSGASGSPELTVGGVEHEVHHQLGAERLDELDRGQAMRRPAAPSVAIAASSKSSGRMPTTTRWPS